ncbi:MULTISPECIES: aminoglycoside 3'-phosphotransferase/choline kinase family protein [unclassified Undibacterium]|uniref:aminoglycoside 3'-phosphotransferase/choline kinase family protein n=1 Tax=unclassified Undibacterium TaxID=2630295 RepID=UPI002AC89ECD|nr:MULTISPECIES: aminoglycoside 3'-phosphotransferase/choline kinase family protein [unclassified Undibacterium]MEB0139410.1 aminoglycoside 3'-phosphotransferase/choline kinase family protein [Undibacterium sp. CCC2.1]MEB0173801.1 aminoglycoside 3'-phosphotransferase/choline kinase family protein [Undibacterium sp. CCC1.1]MEB0177440.1 aminoglycoside 3'-phosphotransferase/choline kinase family protein [Undibacterium sp. CCC3.4]MEB0216611.1 aminoglycoside 3'-phosphotransferase/choline kinase fami
MNISLNCLPQGLDNAACSDFIARTPLPAWLPVLSYVQQQFQLPQGQWEKIAQASNALFCLNDDVIIKLVPPNWRRQGEKEILFAPMLEGKLSLRTPSLIGSAEIDNWLCVISPRLEGVLLADVWPTMELEQKRLIMQQTGQVMRELRALPVDENSAIKPAWPAYLDDLLASCLARHRRNKMPAGLLAQVLPYIERSGGFGQAGALRLIHMDIHPGNLMAKPEDGRWRLDGLLDFGDSIIGNTDRFELLTPMIFMAQGNRLLLKTLIEAYGGLGALSVPELQRQLTAYMLIRPDCDVMFCLQQVPASAARDTWEQIAAQVFPI